MPHSGLFWIPETDPATAAERLAALQTLVSRLPSEITRRRYAAILEALKADYEHLRTRLDELATSRVARNETD